MKSFVVIGMGRFGSSIAKELYKHGNEVMVIDENEELIQDIADDVTHAVVGDAADEAVLRSLGLRNFDVAIIAIGANLEASILVTVLLKEQGIKYILAKAQNELHGTILKKVGADRVILPEKDMAVRVANQLVQSNMLDYIALSTEYSIAEIKVPENWVGKTLKELDIRVHYGINIMAIKSDDGINISPMGEDIIGEDDLIVVIGTDKEIANINKSKR